MDGKIFLLLLLYLILLCGSVNAFDNEITHRDITINAVENSTLKSYLSQNLGQEFSLNYKSVIKGKMVINWIKDGSIAEDSPLCRASNHFHNPLKSWGQSGVSDQPWWISEWCSLTGYSTKYSNITWATGYLGPAPNGSKLTISGQEMGWGNAREYYHLALTSQSSNDREEYFGKAFQSIGQVIHLIEDMAVPAHTRNDFSSHVYFQDAGFRNPTTWFGNSFEWYVKQNPSLVTGSEVVQIDFTNASITRFWDTDVYDGSSRLKDTSLGLAEYTNANFFSDYTIFAESKDSQDVHYFPLPAKSDTNAYLIEQQAEDGTTDKVYYVKLDGEDYKLAAYSYFHWWRNLLPYWGWAYDLDDEVHKGYAQKLVPRAVGYSAWLLNYFFRGELKVVQNTYSDSITITNNSSEKVDGTFALYYDAADGNRKPVSDGSWSLMLEAGNTSDELSFTEPTDLGEDKPYILVFEGTLGNESNAVVGKIGFCVEEFKLTAHDAAKEDWFGYSVAISGDVAIVGAPWDDDAGDWSGAAYIFVRNGERWEEQAKLTVSDAAAQDGFGYSVAISGDVVIVGAPFDSRKAGYDVGSAYVFVRNGEVWEEQAKLTASDATEYDGDNFGWSVAIQGDTAIVGAIMDSDAGDRAGAAYVFMRNGGIWEERAKLTASDAAEKKYFGLSVGISGDVAIVGTWLADSAYIFAYNGATWEEQAKLSPSNSTQRVAFGCSVAISGDVAIVGAGGDDGAGINAGSAYIYVHNGNTWEEKQKLIASDAAAYDEFGYSVAISGDMAIVGSVGDDDAGSNAGSAYVFMRNGDTWEEKKKLTAGDAAARDWLGSSVAISGDVAIVGAYGNDDAGSNSGSAYIYE